MDKTYIHLIITDLPIFASILGVFVLAFGLWKKSDHTIISAFLLLIISSIGAGISYYTGGFAKETIQNLQEDFAESTTATLMEKHEQFALYSLVGLIILGVFSLAGLFVTLKKYSISRAVAFVILGLSLVNFGLVAKTGSLGGEIRHTEIRSNGSNSNQSNDQENEWSDE